MRKNLLSVALLLIMSITATAQNLMLSQKHGFYDKPFELTITDIDNIVSDGSKIRYTLDGSVPTAESTVYNGPISINGTTILRTAVVGSEGLLSNVATATYLFPDDVLHQSDAPEGYPMEWGAYSTIEGIAPADYGMDQEMANDPVIASKIKEGLQSIPVLSIVTDKENFFSHENDEEKGGIYIFTGPPVGDPTGNGWTRPVNAELFGCGHDFSVTCGIRLHGGHGRLAEKNPKHSLRLVFKKEYGEKTLKYPLFGEEEPNKFDQLVLRCHFGNSWQHWMESNRQKAQYTRDIWARRIQRKMGWTSVNALYVHVFLNGMYWGLYNIAERVDDQYGKDHLGGKKEDIDVIKIEEEGGNHIEASEGDLEAWENMVETAANAYDDAYYFIDYMLINQYAGNTDWDHHNWYAIRRKGEESQGFRFLCWDSELILDNPHENVLTKNNGKESPTGIFNHLLENKDFAKRYMARAKELLADDGMLGAKSTEEVWDSLYNNISTALYAEAARWGDYRRDVHPYQTPGTLYTVDETYMTERNRLHEQYFPYRSSTVLSMIENILDIDDFEPLAEWIPLTASFFHKWDGTGKNANVMDMPVNVDWNVGKEAGSGVAVAGFVNVDHDNYADISGYDKLIIRGKGNNLRILANRLVAHGQWKEIKVSFNEYDKYWDDDLKCIVIPLDDFKTKLTSSNETRIDDFVHLHVLKVDWNNNLKVNGVWLVPNENSTDIKSVCQNRNIPSDNRYYNLNGQVVDNPSNGVYIYNGKKVVK